MKTKIGHIQNTPIVTGDLNEVNENEYYAISEVENTVRGYPTWRELMDTLSFSNEKGLIVGAGNNGAEMYYLQRVETSDGVFLCLTNYAKSRCLGEIEYPEDLDTEATTFTIGKYLTHSSGLLDAGTLKRILFNGEDDFTTSEKLPITYSYVDNPLPEITIDFEIRKEVNPYIKTTLKKRIQKGGSLENASIELNTFGKRVNVGSVNNEAIYTGDDNYINEEDNIISGNSIIKKKYQ